MSAARTTLPGRLSQSYTLLEMIAISGELPADNIPRIIACERYRERILHELKINNLTRVFHKDKLRGLRLTSKAKELLLADNPERFLQFLTGNAETNRLKGEYKRRLRLHRLSETYVTMRNAGIAVFRDEKPNYFAATGNKPTQPPVNPCFFSSREIKDVGQECVKIRGSRSAGLILTNSDAYIVYNAGSFLMKWDYNAETRAKTLIQTMLNMVHPTIHGMMLGSDMQLARQLLTCADGVSGNYLILGRDVGKFLYITNNYKGETLIRLLCDNRKRTILNSRLSEGLNNPHPGMRIENDALDADGNPVLFAYDFDMPRIIRFNNALQLYGRTGTLICFDFQAEVCRSYCCGNTHIKTIDFASFQRRFYP